MKRLSEQANASFCNHQIEWRHQEKHQAQKDEKRRHSYKNENT
jgi:hypothetical protein